MYKLIFALILIIALPKVNSISPTSGNEGTIITISGNNLENTLLVKVGFETAQINSKSNNSVVIVAPKQRTVGKKNITVITWGRPTQALKDAFEYK